MSNNFSNLILLSHFAAFVNYCLGKYEMLNVKMFKVEFTFWIFQYNVQYMTLYTIYIKSMQPTISEVL